MTLLAKVIEGVSHFVMGRPRKTKPVSARKKSQPKSEVIQHPEQLFHRPVDKTLEIRSALDVVSECAGLTYRNLRPSPKDLESALATFRHPILDAIKACKAVKKSLEEFYPLPGELYFAWEMRAEKYAEQRFYETIAEAIRAGANLEATRTTTRFIGDEAALGAPWRLRTFSENDVRPKVHLTDVYGRPLFLCCEIILNAARNGAEYPDNTIYMVKNSSLDGKITEFTRRKSGWFVERGWLVPSRGVGLKPKRQSEESSGDGSPSSKPGA